MGVIVPFLVSRMFRLIPLFHGGYSVGMSGPVPGAGRPLLRPSFGFFSMELCQFVVNAVNVVVVVVVVVVAYWVGLTTFRPKPFSRSGYSVGMSGPVPGPGSPSPRQSLGFFGLELPKFVLVKVNVVVAWWVRRGGAFGAVARATAALLDAFYVRHREMAAVLVGA